MPMTPHKGESQTDFMHRCMTETFTGDRPQDQAVAICSDYWRQEHGGKKPAAKEHADPGYMADGKKRFALDTTNEIRMAWGGIHVDKFKEWYTPAQLERIKTRIAAAWRQKIDQSGPPAHDDQVSMLALRREVVIAAKQYAPDPDDGESHDDFIDRCVDEVMDDNDSMDEDQATEACQLAWDENNGDGDDDDERGAGAVLHKTHASTDGGGMEFVLSDATPDRFGDVVEPKGFEVDAFQKNPICLFNHDKGFIIGKWQDLKVGNTDLRGHLQLAPKGTSPRIDEIRRLVEADILRAVSVGFRPLEDEPINKKDPWGGTRYMKHELIEASLVAVPANPNALAVAKSLNISPTTVRMVFGEHASDRTVQRQFARGEHADTKRESVKENSTGEHAEPEKRARAKGKPMLLSQRIQEAEKGLLALQDNLDRHLEGIDDTNPSEEQMTLTEDYTAKIETASRHLNNLKAIETKNASSAEEPGEITRKGNGTNGHRPPPGITLRQKKVEPLDYLFRAAVIRCKSKSDGQSIDDTRRKIYGDDEATRVICDYVLKAASAPAETQVTGWAADLVRTMWTDWMAVLLPTSVHPRLSAAGLALTFGANGRIVIPTRSLTPSISGSFVAEGAPIPVRQGQFLSQTLVPKKLAVITTWTREMDQYSIPAIEGLLRQAVIEDTAIAIDTVLLDNNVATAIRPPGLRSYQAGLTPSAIAGNPFGNFVADYQSLMGSLITLTNGNVRKPVLITNPAQTLALSLVQPPGAATPLFPFMSMIDGGRILQADLIQSATVPIGQVILVDAADFTSVGTEGPRLEISDAATLHMEDTTPQDIVSGPSGTPVAATPVKSMWQTDSLALRLIMMNNWILRRPVVAWMTGVQW